MKQMKIIHQNGFTEQERLDYRPVVFKNLTESAQAIVIAMRKLGVSPEDPTNRVCSVTTVQIAWAD